MSSLNVRSSCPEDNLLLLATAALSEDIASTHPLQISCDGLSDTSSECPSPQSTRRSTMAIRHTRQTRQTIKLQYRSPTPAVSPPNENSLVDERQTYMRTLMERANRIKTVSNSPANELQQCIMRMVFNDITKYPTEHWISIIAVAINRSYNQVKFWFSNERQSTRRRQKTDDLALDTHVLATTEDGDKVKFRPRALEICSVWSDDFFMGLIFFQTYILRNNMTQ